MLRYKDVVNRPEDCMPVVQVKVQQQTFVITVKKYMKFACCVTVSFSIRNLLHVIMIFNAGYLRHFSLSSLKS